MYKKHQKWLNRGFLTQKADLSIKILCLEFCHVIAAPIAMHQTLNHTGVQSILAIQTFLFVSLESEIATLNNLSYGDLRAYFWRLDATKISPSIVKPENGYYCVL